MTLSFRSILRVASVATIGASSTGCDGLRGAAPLAAPVASAGISAARASDDKVEAPKPAAAGCAARIEALRADLKQLKAVSSPSFGSILNTPDIEGFGIAWRIAHKGKAFNVAGMSDGKEINFEGGWDGKRAIAISADGRFALDWKTNVTNVIGGTVFESKVSGSVLHPDEDSGACVTSTFARGK